VKSFNAFSIAEMKRTLVTFGALCLILAGCSNYVEASPPKAAFIGDSITAGHGASSEQTRWTSLVSQKMGWIEHNFGRGGTGYLATSSREGCGLDFCPNYLGMLNDVVSSDPEIVVVAGGANDMAEFVSNSGPVSRAITDTFNELRMRLPNARIIAVGPFGRDITSSLIAFDLVVQDAARAIGGEYVSLIAPNPVVREDMFLADGAHVNDSGHAAIADRITSVLQRFR
jgi:lysophospholipase L1-like esterase